MLIIHAQCWNCGTGFTASRTAGTIWFGCANAEIWTRTSPFYRCAQCGYAFTFRFYRRISRSRGLLF